MFRRNYTVFITSSSLEKKFTEAFTPSGAVKSGFARTTPRDEVPPTELNGSMIGTGVPYAGVFWCIVLRNRHRACSVCLSDDC